MTVLGAFVNGGTVRLLSSGIEGAYNEYVAANDHALLYATLAYRDLLTEYLRCDARYLVAHSARGEIVGVLPAMLSKPGVVGPVLNSLPYYGSNGGVLVHDNNEPVRRALIDGFHRLAEAEACAASTIITSPYDVHVESYGDDSVDALRDERIGLLTPLPLPHADAELSLLASFDEARRRNIRRARKAGVTVAPSEDEADLRFLHATHTDNMRVIGGRAKDYAFFAAAMHVLPRSQRRLYVARIGDERVAALLLMYGGRTVEYFTPATVDRFKSDQPLSLIIFQAMLDAVRAGYQMWNWGGTWLSQHGVYDFKRRWGTVERRYYYFTRVRDPRLRRCTPAELSASYPHFYVMPYHACADSAAA